MGSGKTSIGKALARQLNFNFIDTDKLISSFENLSINEIFEKKGESYFRQLESDFISELSLDKTPTVFSTGGGLPINPINFQIMKQNGVLFYLNLSEKFLYSRLKNDSKRPLIREANDLYLFIVDKLAERKTIYESADFTIDASLSKKEIIIEIEKKWNLF